MLHDNLANIIKILIFYWNIKDYVNTVIKELINNK
jgi:hypothetical protein